MVLENLQAQGFDVFFQLAKFKEISRNIELTTVLLFGRYKFIRLSDISGNYASIRSTRCVASLLGFGSSTAWQFLT
jgi:hypothetical protein